MSTEHYLVVLFGIEPEQLVSYQSQNMGIVLKVQETQSREYSFD